MEKFNYVKENEIQQKKEHLADKTLIIFLLYTLFLYAWDIHTTIATIGHIILGIVSAYNQYKAVW